MYEAYDHWPEHGIAGVLADGHGQWISDEIRFNKMLEATLVPAEPRGESPQKAPRDRSPMLLLPSGRASRSTAELFSIESEWQKYVREFIERYNLNEGQQESALSILRELEGRAARYRSMQSARFDELDGLLRTLRPMDSHGSFQRAIMGLREERRRLEQPIDEMFDQLKERLGRLPTAEQRRVAEARP